MWHGQILAEANFGLANRDTCPKQLWSLMLQLDCEKSPTGSWIRSLIASSRSIGTWLPPESSDLTNRSIPPPPPPPRPDEKVILWHCLDKMKGRWWIRSEEVGHMDGVPLGTKSLVLHLPILYSLLSTSCLPPWREDPLAHSITTMIFCPNT